MSKLIAKFITLFASTILLFGCSSPTISQYANEKPALDLSEYFSGTVDAYGIFTNRSGEVVKRFTVLIQCHWKTIDGKKVGTLDEILNIQMALSRSVSGH